MKVAMVTPMSRESAIADVMLQAVPHLSEEWDIDVWCPTESEYRPCPVEVYPYSEADDEVQRELSHYDLVVYVLGNSPWHSRILPLARVLPGLVVLHDVAMTDLVRHTASERGDLELVTQRAAAESSVDDAEVFRRGHPPDGPEGWMALSARIPFADYAVEGSLGVVVHSQWHAGLVTGRTLGDVTTAPLPVPSSRLGFETNRGAEAEEHLGRLPDDAILLVTVGAANANRRIDALIDALATDDTSLGRVHLWAVGPADPAATAHLHDRARQAGLGNRFEITGTVTDALLRDILVRADIAAALRDPVLEGQSASVLTQMLAALPLLVLDHAHYSELPDDAVLKVDPVTPVPQLRAHLRTLVEDPEARRHRGGLARDYVLSTRSGEAYAEALALAGTRAVAARAHVQLSVDLSERLRRLGLNKAPSITGTVTDLTLELFDLQ